MKKLLCAACFLLPGAASAEHWDVIAFEMTDACSFDEYMEIVSDFNEWGAAYGYNAKVAAPLQSDDLATYFWIGTSENAAAFGAAWDAWRDDLGDSNSTPSKLWARFQKCEVNKQRTGYDVY